jgi:hypothetical protein
MSEPRYDPNQTRAITSDSHSGTNSGASQSKQSNYDILSTLKKLVDVYKLDTSGIVHEVTLQFK